MPCYITRYSGKSRKLAALLDSGKRRRDGLPGKPPEKKRYHKQIGKSALSPP